MAKWRSGGRGGGERGERGEGERIWVRVVGEGGKRKGEGEKEKM